MTGEPSRHCVEVPPMEPSALGLAALWACRATILASETA